MPGSPVADLHRPPWTGTQSRVQYGEEGRSPICRSRAGGRAFMKITYGAVLPLPPEQAFDFVSDSTKWPTFFESMESAEALQGWGSPGGKARMVSKFLGRSVVSELELVEWDRPHRFRYTALTAGRPDMDNVRILRGRSGRHPTQGNDVGQGQTRSGRCVRRDLRPGASPGVQARDEATARSSGEGRARRGLRHRPPSLRQIRSWRCARLPALGGTDLHVEPCRTNAQRSASSGSSTPFSELGTCGMLTASSGGKLRVISPAPPDRFCS